MAKIETFHSLITFVLFAALCFLGYLWYSGQILPRAQVAGENLTGGGSTLMKTEEQFRNKLIELNMQRDKVRRGLAQMERNKAESVKDLRAKGIVSGEDFINSSDPDVKKKAIGLQGWVTQITKTNKEIGYYDEAISSIKGMLDRIERERINDSIALSEDEYLELQKVIVDLNERLNVDTTILEDEELGKLLDLEMAGSK